MVDVHQLIACCTMSLLLSAVPGPSVLFVVGRALAHGRGTALASVLGNALGGCVLVVAVALGVGSLVERSVPHFDVVRLVGAAHLVFLGAKALRASWRDGRAGAAGAPGQARGGGAGRPVRVGRPVRAGLVVGVTNPKSVVFLTAVLPQFVDREAGHVGARRLVVGLSGAVLQLLSGGVSGLTASTARAWLGRSPRRTALIGGTGGLAVIGLGLGLGATVAVTGRADQNQSVSDGSGDRHRRWSADGT